MVRSVAQRIGNKFQAAVAEVADNDAWHLATLGVAVVSNDTRHCEAMLHAIIDYVQESRLDAEMLNVETDVIAMDED